MKSYGKPILIYLIGLPFLYYILVCLYQFCGEIAERVLALLGNPQFVAIGDKHYKLAGNYVASLVFICCIHWAKFMFG